MNRFIPVLGLLALSFVSSTFAADWLHWRGPEQAGVSRDTGLPDKWSPDKPGQDNLIWKQPFGGRSAPLVSKGKVYIINGAGEGITEQERVMCFDAKTGEKLWEHKFNIFHTDIVTSRVGWANLAGDPETGNVYAHGIQGLFFCFSPDGKILWSKSLTEEYGRITGYGGRIPSPIVDEDLVIINFLNSSWGDHSRGGHRFLALDKKSGTPVWWSEPGGQPLDTIYSIPVVAVINGQRLLICGGADGALHAMKARTGEKVWSVPLSKRGLNVSPVVSGNLVYITQGEENLEPGTRNGAVCCFDASKVANGQPALVWRHTNVLAGYASPIVHQGRLYVPDNSAKLYCFNAADGTLLWDHKYGTSAKASPVWGNGKIYVGEVPSRFSILQPEANGCKTLHTVEFPPGADGQVMEINGSAAIADGRVYLVTGNGLYCIGTKEPKPGVRPESPKEPPVDPSAKPAHLQVVPADIVLPKGGTANFKVRAFDGNGRFLKEVEAEWSLPTPTPPPPPPGGAAPPAPPPLKGTISKEGKLDLDGAVGAQNGYVQAKVGDLTARARVRVAPLLPITQDFEAVPVGAIPSGWINAGGKFVVEERVDGGMRTRVLKKLANNPNPLLARANAYIGMPSLKDYTIEADLLGTEKRSSMPNMGVINSRYTLWLDGNKQRLLLSSWEANHRFEKILDPFEWKPDVWYRFKLQVLVEKGEAICRGKVWPRDEKEPEAWTAEIKDPIPNAEGSPGVYAYALGILDKGGGQISPGTEVFYDNIRVMPNQAK